jgi:hypothetical protein
MGHQYLGFIQISGIFAKLIAVEVS